jgi:hypothetical protein
MVMPDTTAPPKPTTREIASIVGYGRDITRSYLGKLLDPQDKVLRRWWYDYEVYEDLLRDDQVKATFQQRRSAVISREWEVKAGGEKKLDKDAADFIRKTLEEIRWDNIADKMLFGVYYGYGIGECIWVVRDNQIHLDTIKVRKQRRFKFDWEMKPRLLTWQAYTDGEALPDRKFWHYSTGADNDDEPYGLGLAHWLYWPVYFKKNGIKSWLKFLERFAQPTVKGAYGPEAGDKERQALKSALQAFGEDAAVMVPEGVEIDLIEAARSGQADYGGLCDRMDAAIAKIVLSQTMTTDNGSSRSQAEVHSGVKLEVIKSDADLIDASANATWVKWLVDWNFPGAAYPSISRVLDDAENLNERADRDKTLSDLGFRLTPEKVEEIYGDGYYDPAQIKEESGEKPPLVSVLGVGGTEALVNFLQQLSQMALTRENAISTLVTVFGISRVDAEAMVPEDAQLEGAAPIEPVASLDQAAALFSDSVEFGAIIDRVIDWNGLKLGVEYLPGQVRFPGRKNSKKLRSGYGHIRNYKGADGEALDCYLAPAFFGEAEPSQLIFEVTQLADDGDFDEHKFMLGYGSIEDAEAAYQREMPAEFFGGIRAVDRDELEQYSKDVQFAESQRLFAVLQVLDQSVEVDMLTFAETQSNAAMEAAIGRRFLALLQPGAVDFASGGGKKCTTGLSCGSSCISKAKVCVKTLSPEQQAQYKALVKKVKAGDTSAQAEIDGIRKQQQGGESNPEQSPLSPNQFIAPSKNVERSYKIPATGRSEVSAQDVAIPFGPNALREMAGRRVLWSTSVSLLDDIPAEELSGAIGAIIDSDPQARTGKGETLVAVHKGFDPKMAAKFRSLGAEPIDDAGTYVALRWDGEDLKPITAADKTEIAAAQDRWNRHREAFRDVESMSVDVSIASIVYKGNKNKMLALIEEPLKAHREATKKLWAAEDKDLSRSPTKQSRKKLEKALQAEAQDWAKSMGFTGEGVNGFSADATKAHDIAHPATHRLAGMNSQQINRAFGDLKDANGKPSLLAEEALVNAVEHLSRGDTKEASIQNGLRLAKVLSRNATEAERQYVRSEEFARGLIDVIENRIYKNNEYSNLMPIVRDYNVISGTVTTSGADFTNSASGG